MALSNRAGIEWLKANDPEYVSPQQKGAKTRATPVDPETLGELMARQVSSVKRDGRYVQATPIGFAGDFEQGSGTLEAIDETANVHHGLVQAELEATRHKHGKRKNGAARRKARKARRLAIANKRKGEWQGEVLSYRRKG